MVGGVVNPASAAVIGSAANGANSILSDLTKGIPTALATLVIGIVAASIALRQYRVAHAKFKLDLFEKRYAVYQATVHMLSSFATGSPYGQVTSGMPAKFRAETSAATFLFDADIAAFIDRVANEADVAADGINGDHVWASNELKTIADRFRPYMEMKEWR
jgi:hypothetical protein